MSRAWRTDICDVLKQYKVSGNDKKAPFINMIFN